MIDVLAYIIMFLFLAVPVSCAYIAIKELVMRRFRFKAYDFRDFLLDELLDTPDMEESRREKLSQAVQFIHALIFVFDNWNLTLARNLMENSHSDGPAGGVNPILEFASSLGDEHFVLMRDILYHFSMALFFKSDWLKLTVLRQIARDLSEFRANLEMKESVIHNRVRTDIAPSMPVREQSIQRNGMIAA